MNRRIVVFIMMCVSVVIFPSTNAMESMVIEEQDAEKYPCEKCLNLPECFQNDDRGIGVMNLIQACTWGHAECVAAFLQESPKLVQECYSKCTPLHFACASGRYKCAEILVENMEEQDVLYRIEAKNDSGDTPLYCAFVAKNLDIIRILCKKGASRKVFHSAEQAADLFPICYTCLVKDSHAQSLYNAVTSGHSTCLEKLLEWSTDGIDILAEETNSSLLYIAAYRLEEKSVDLLCQYGVNVRCKNNWGRAPLHAVFYGGGDDQAKAVAIVIKLIEHGADVNELEDWGWTPYSYADYYGYDQVAAHLKNKCGAIDTRFFRFNSTNVKAGGALVVLGVGAAAAMSEIHDLGKVGYWSRILVIAKSLGFGVVWGKKWYHGALMLSFEPGGLGRMTGK